MMSMNGNGKASTERDKTEEERRRTDRMQNTILAGVNICFLSIISPFSMLLSYHNYVENASYRRPDFKQHSAVFSEIHRKASGNCNHLVTISLKNGLYL